MIFNPRSKMKKKYHQFWNIPKMKMAWKLLLIWISHGVESMLPGLMFTTQLESLYILTITNPVKSILWNYHNGPRIVVLWGFRVNLKFKIITHLLSLPKILHFFAFLSYDRIFCRFLNVVQLQDTAPYNHMMDTLVTQIQSLQHQLQQYLQHQCLSQPILLLLLPLLLLQQQTWCNFIALSALPMKSWWSLNIMPPWDQQCLL